MMIEANKPSDKKPLMYACSGCSNTAQLANTIAVDFNREGIAEMSCIAGVGGDVKPLVKTAKSNRIIIAIDGCSLACVKNCLARHGVDPTHQFVLTSYGIKKSTYKALSKTKIEWVKRQIKSHITLYNNTPK